MGKFLFKVQETFQLKVIGLVVVVDIKIKDAKVNMSDEIELRLNNDSLLITKVAGIQMLSPYDPERMFSFSLPRSINKKNVPIGTEIWSYP